MEAAVEDAQPRTLGAGGTVPAGVVIRRPVAPESIVEHVATSLPRFKKPRRMRFVEALPMTAAGKVRRGEARNRLDRAE